MANIGYMRISTDVQTFEAQTHALKPFECIRIFSDTGSGFLENRPGLRRALDFLRQGDTLIVWSLDRLGRSLPQLLETVQTIQEAGAELYSVREKIDTSKEDTKHTFELFATLAQLEGEIIKERVNIGLAAAREAGRFGGRPRAVNHERAKKIDEFREAGMSPSQICTKLKISRSTYFRYTSKTSSYKEGIKAKHN